MEIRGHSHFETVFCQLAPGHATIAGLHVGARNVNSDLHTTLTSALLKEPISQVCLGFVLCLFVYLFETESQVVWADLKLDL